jgi:(S)-citramalyl-CoA lyase
MVDHAARVAGVRSWLYTPGTQPHRFDRAAEAGADGLIIDLEDAVPARDKDRARANAVACLSDRARHGVLRAVRINPPATRAGLRDLDALVGSGGTLDAIVIPKCESPAVVGLVATLFAEAGATPAVIGLVESATGVAGIAELVWAPALTAIAVGAADLSADLGCTPAWESLAAARALIVLHASAARLPVVDSPFFDLADTPGLRAEAAAAAALGFRGKAAIHPDQIAAINRAFTPSSEEVAWAHAVLAVADDGVGLVDGVMVDEAVARRARQVLDAVARRES